MNNEQKQKDKEQILSLVKDYADKYLSNINIEKFDDKKRISYAGRIFDSSEVVNLVDSSLDFWLTQGRFYDEFEDKLKKYLGVKYLSYVNSGSSANLLALKTLLSPLLKERQLKRGDEVITVACGFPTTVAPILDSGLVPVFVDVDIPTYNIKVEDMEKAFSDKTKAVFIAHTLGNPYDINYVKEFCDKHNLWLIEDNCDALGSQAKVNGKYMKTGTIGDIGTSSFYPAHHMTTGEGGAVYTNNPLLHKIIQSLRDWGRDCICKSGVDDTCKKRYDGDYGRLPHGYDHKYVYSHLGFNLKATDLQAAIGVAQLDKLDAFTKKRIENFNLLYTLLQEAGAEEYFILPKATKDTIPSWFSFIITCKDNVDREKVVRYIESHNIQTRMLFAGNIIKQPLFDEYVNDTTKYRVVGDLKNTDKIMNKTFMVGVFPGLDEDRIKYMARIIMESTV